MGFAVMVSAESPSVLVPEQSLSKWVDGL